MSTGKHDWAKNASCKGQNQSLFFEAYEDDVAPYPIRNAVDDMCQSCPVRKMCFAVGVMPDPNGYNNWGVWGGFYLKDGKVSVEHNSHKDMAEAYASLVLE